MTSGWQGDLRLDGEFTFVTDAILIHVAPILVGDGTRLFEYLGCDPIGLDISDVIHSPHATHIYYGVRNPT